MQRASYVAGEHRVERWRFGGAKRGVDLYVVVLDGEKVWPPDMPGVDDLGEARLQADRLEAAREWSASLTG